MALIVADLHLIDLGAVNAYLWTGEGGPTLIDCGMGNTFDKLMAAMDEAGVAPADLRRIIITHSDMDHMGGLRKLRALTTAPVCCHTVEAAYVLGKKRKGPNPSLVGYLIRPIFALIARATDSSIEQVEELMVDGDVLPEGFMVLHMPGHAPGQIALYHKQRGILIAADALNNRGGKLGLPPTLFTPSMQQAVESLDALRKLKYETACFGHGPAIAAGADEKVQAFVESLSS